MILSQWHEILAVRSRSRHLSLVSQLSVIEPLILGLKVTGFLDDLNSCLLDALALEMPSLGHLLIDLVKACGYFILARSWDVGLVRR